MPAILWVLAYFVWFFSFELPNSTPRVGRRDVLEMAPVFLLNDVDPARPDRNAQNHTIAQERWEHSGWKYAPQRFGLCAVAAFIVAGGWGLGQLLLRLIRVPLRARSVERNVLGTGLGMSGLSLLTLACGLAGFLSRPFFVAVLAASLVGELIGQFRERPSSSGEESSRDRWNVGLTILASTPFLLCFLLGSFLPETDFDVREYHFEGPKEWFQAGRISFLPHNVYTSFPFLTEMLTLLGMVLYGDWYWGAVAGKGLLMCFGPLTALGLFGAGKRWFGTTAGLFAAWIHLSTPWIYRISIIAYAEGGLTFYLFAAIFATGLGIERLLVRDSPVDSGETATSAARFGSSGISEALRFFFVAGLLAGSAMACKYPGLVSVLFPLGAAIAVVPFVVRRPTIDPIRAALRGGIVFLLGAALTIGPWLAKNEIETGNPVYPLMYGLFGGRDWDAALDAKWKHAHSPDNYRLSDFAEKFIDVTSKADWLSPLLFGLAPLAFLSLRTRRLTSFLWLYVAYLFLTWWGLTHRLDRFWVPLIPVVSLLAGAGATWSRSLVWRWFVAGCVCFVGFFNLAFITTSLCGNNSYLLDLTLARKTTANHTIAFLNERLPPGSKVLCVGEAEVFDATFPLVYNTVFDHSIFQEWCARPDPGVPADELPLRPADEIRQAFRDAGITHVFVNWQEIVRYRTTYGYTDFVAPGRFKELQRLGVLGAPWKVPAQIPFDSLDDSPKAEIERWGPELIEGSGQTARFVSFQVFPVESRER